MDKPDKKKTPLSGYAKYSTLALQMGFTVVLCTFGGRWIDSLLGFNFPVFTIVGILLGVAAAMYFVIKKL
ncbi:MAG: AtpZ/AtpI family protein [Bacteroidia bacterium]|nr:AtpZ/AtpI family protein [Bacteroidia bacterium]